MASANDMDMAKKTYGNFLSLMKYSIPPIVLIVAFIVWLIA